MILAAYGSPDSRQIDGIGGGDPLTSKVAVVEKSSRPDADVDYTFGQVGIDAGTIFWVGNCGNMSSGVGPFAIRQGLVSAESPVTRVRIFNTNTNKVLVAEMEVRDGEVVEEGDTHIAGVPGTGSPILLDFGDCGGAVTGKTLPTGNTRDSVLLRDGRTVEVSIVDATTVFVFVRAADIGMRGTESASEIDADTTLLSRLEEVRSYAARTIGLVGEDEDARVVSPSIPRVVAVSEPSNYSAKDGTVIGSNQISIIARQLSMQRAHKTYSVTGTLCTAVASAIPGTVVSQLARQGGEYFNIGHPAGIIAARVDVAVADGHIDIREASIVRTARAIMDGALKIPRRIWP